MTEWLVINGAYGEGGGQILRTALSLSSLLRIPVRLEAIRAKREKPGLSPQHLTAVRALQQICRAKVEGASLGSQELLFAPGEVKPGNYDFDVGTAGATTLIFQTLLLPLLFSGGESRIRLQGGTHVPLSPPYHYLERVFLPALKRMGVRVELQLSRWGWAPRGGGEFQARVHPIERLSPLSLSRSWKPGSLEVLCASSHLPGHIREREKKSIEMRLQARGLSTRYELIEGPSPGQGNIVFIGATGPEGWAGFSSLGRRGKRAEQVSEETTEALLAFLESGAAVDEYLADQLIPYLALAQGESEILARRSSSHLETNLWLVGQFIKLKIEADEKDRPKRFRISGVPDEGLGDNLKPPIAIN